MMIAQTGDRLVLHGIHVGDNRRVGVITEIRRSDCSPPYLVRWLDNGHETLVFPGPEARVEPAHRNVTD
jgi:uncharacterized protein DUF1918